METFTFILLVFDFLSRSSDSNDSIHGSALGGDFLPGPATTLLVTLLLFTKFSLLITFAFDTVLAVDLEPFDIVPFTTTFFALLFSGEIDSLFLTSFLLTGETLATFTWSLLSASFLLFSVSTSRVFTDFFLTIFASSTVAPVDVVLSDLIPTFEVGLAVDTLEKLWPLPTPSGLVGLSSFDILGRFNPQHRDTTNNSIVILHCRLTAGYSFLTDNNTNNNSTVPVTILSNVHYHTTYLVIRLAYRAAPNEMNKHGLVNTDLSRRIVCSEQWTTRACSTYCCSPSALYEICCNELQSSFIYPQQTF